MIWFTTQVLEMKKSLKQRIEFICEFCHVTPTLLIKVSKELTIQT